VGRPTKFEDRLIGKCKALAEQGKTNEQIAAIIGVNVDTLYVWQSKFREFSEALKEGKSLADDLVEASLFRRAIGYKETIPKQAVYFGKVVEYEDTMACPPDTVAAIFWLKNRRPNEWRDKTEGKVEDDITLNIRIGHEDDANGESEHHAPETDPAAETDPRK